MKYVIGLVLLLSSSGSAVGAEAQTPDKRIDELVAQLIELDPNLESIHNIRDLNNNDGIEGWIASKKLSQKGTYCPFCNTICALAQLSEHVFSDCKQTLGAGSLCLVTTKDKQPIHYCIVPTDDTIEKIQAVLEQSSPAAFVLWCAPE